MPHGSNLFLTGALTSSGREVAGAKRDTKEPTGEIGIGDEMENSQANKPLEHLVTALSLPAKSGTSLADLSSEVRNH